MSYDQPLIPTGLGLPGTGEEAVDGVDFKKLFGTMYKTCDDLARVDKYILPSNADSDEDLFRICKQHAHKGSCFCKFAGSVLGVFIPCCFAKRCAVIEPQQFGVVVHSGYPELMGPGTHCLPSCRQRFRSKVDQGALYIQEKGMHIIQIPAGMVGLAKRNGQPIFLGAGRHAIFDGLFVFDQQDVRSLNEHQILHGTVSLIKVPRGALGFGTNTDSPEPVVLGEGFHIIDTPFFKFRSLINLNEKQTSLGPMKLVRVETGDAGIAYISGKLTILEPGLHLLVPPNRFHSLLSTQQTVLQLPTAVHESGDYVPLRVKADVFYRIANPLLAVTAVDDITRTIRETASATLAGIIRSSTLQDIAKSSKPTHGADPVPDAHASSAPSFYTFVHDHFISELHDDCLRKWGIELQNIRIESLNIDDARLAAQISEQSLIYARTQAQLANLEADRHIRETEAERDANVKIQHAQAQKKSIELAAQATARARTLEAKAKAEGSILKARGAAAALKIKAKADAEAIVREAEAEKSRLELEGDGQRRFAESVEKTKFGPRFAQLEVEKKLLVGTDKIYFSRHLPAVYSDAGVVEKVEPGPK